MRDLEHPLITRTLRTGYPEVVAQPECFGLDYFQDEILYGDEIVEDPNNNETVLKENLERYLAEVYEFQFKTID